MYERSRDTGIPGSLLTIHDPPGGDMNLSPVDTGIPMAREIPQENFARMDRLRVFFLVMALSSV